MNIVQIPIPYKGASFSQTINLNEIEYRLDFNYNSRGNYWTISIYDKLDNPILQGAKLSLNFNTFKRHVHDPLLLTQLLPLDLTKTLLSIGYDDLKDKIGLYYVAN